MEKAGFEPRTVGAMRGAVTAALHARLRFYVMESSSSEIIAAWVLIVMTVISLQTIVSQMFIDD